MEAMTMEQSTQTRGARLPILSDEKSLEAELATFEAAERERLGLASPERVSWTETMARPMFTAAERPKVTLWVSGLTMAHDLLVEAALAGLGYKVQHLDCPDNDALRFGKEFGNRGQCNPTYYTVGNLVKHLEALRAEGKSREEILESHVFLTAGACGPCRFGMYVTEYRKALRDAGYEGFRVLLFQQTGGFRQATGEEAGLRFDPPFFIGLAKALLAGDVLNALGYRLRPYELEPGATDRALEDSKQLLYEALSQKRSLLRALWRCRRRFAEVKVDRLQAKPRVSIIGEFWAMTTEGDGNYQLQRFLESEGAECDIQLVSAWLLYMLWEGRYDTTLRAGLAGADGGRKGLRGVKVARRMALLRLAEVATRGSFQLFARLAGLSGYKLPNLDEIHRHAAPHYNTLVRGGESYMEVGKLIVNAIHQKANLTVSVKPFGCMPSSGVSDGVQSLVTEKYPGANFLAVETSGDGKVNFLSRIQMSLFKARKQAQDELAAALAETGLTLEQARARAGRRNPLSHPQHQVASTAANWVYELRGVR